MDFISTRNSYDLSQSELAILLGVPVANIQNWEQGRRTQIDSSTITLYELLNEVDEHVNLALLTIACKKHHPSLKDINTLKRVLKKIIKDPLQKSFLEAMLMTSNSQFTPEQLGFITTVTPTAQ
jgi:transcriptional regulator with XRE-family HTH domain